MNPSTPRHYFDRLYTSDDPYGYRNRWYEQRKRSLLMASLTQPRFENAWEMGCSNGELTAALAARCDALLATDFSDRAIALARQRTVGAPHVSAHQAHHPLEWPSGTFDLIVFSEVGYFMSQRDLEITASKLSKSLADTGLIVACHWLPEFAEAPLSGEAVHDVLRSRLGLSQKFHYEDHDFLLEGWSAQRESLAELEGLR